MSDSLSLLQASCAAINKAHFSPPGIFTNAILTKPEVTSLIRDALPAEAGLYKIVAGLGLLSLLVASPRTGELTELKPVRIDGKSVFVDHATRQQPGAAAHVPLRTPDVPVPSDESLPSDEWASPVKRRALALHKLVPTHLMDSENVLEMYAALRLAVERRPGMPEADSVVSRAEALRNEYIELLHETETLEAQVAEQKYQLDRHNDSLNQLLPTRGNFSPRRPMSVDELLRQEEAEIERLESELNAQRPEGSS